MVFDYTPKVNVMAYTVMHESQIFDDFFALSKKLSEKIISELYGCTFLKIISR